ncbi:MAG: hypothetical protein ACI9X4_000294, partial [Glaciecola sp.]
STWNIYVKSACSKEKEGIRCRIPFHKSRTTSTPQPKTGHTPPAQHRGPNINGCTRKTYAGSVPANIKVLHEL